MSGSHSATLTWYQWLAVAAILLAQGTWIFLDARKRGDRAWLWGLYGLIQFPTPLIIYLLVTRYWGKVRCPACGRRQQQQAPHCENCGEPLPGVCQSCGRPLHRDWVCCPHCGQTKHE